MGKLSKIAKEIGMHIVKHSLTVVLSKSSRLSLLGESRRFFGGGDDAATTLPGWFTVPGNLPPRRGGATLPHGLAAMPLFRLAHPNESQSCWRPGSMSRH